MADPHDLQRFVDAQERLYLTVLDELRRGQKRSHWMWFIFPQAEGLGRSSMAQHYAVKSRREVEAYMAHPLLGARLCECVVTVLTIPRKTANQIFGSPDDLKFRSSLTLFDAMSDEPHFSVGLERFFEGRPDPMTLDVIRNWTD
jgi:uncharacterized protein (DUF1810 family)